MPIYEYSCQKCSTHFERLVKTFSEKVLCPDCSSPKVERMLSVFSAISPAGAACSNIEACPTASKSCCGGGKCGHKH